MLGGIWLVNDINCWRVKIQGAANMLICMPALVSELYSFWEDKKEIRALSWDTNIHKGFGFVSLIDWYWNEGRTSYWEIVSCGWNCKMRIGTQERFPLCYTIELVKEQWDALNQRVMGDGWAVPGPSVWPWVISGQYVLVGVVTEVVFSPHN